MAEMVERVARAMKPTIAKLVDSLVAMGADPTEAVALLPLVEARAAIEAMREPTEAMEQAGWEQIPDQPDDWSPVSAYERMVGAALLSSPPAKE